MQTQPTSRSLASTRGPQPRTQWHPLRVQGGLLAARTTEKCVVDREARWNARGRQVLHRRGWSAPLKDSSPLITTVRDKYGVTTSTTQRYTYRGPEYTGKNGALCRRYVVVDYSPRLKEVAAGQPAASMITSYGRKLS